MLPLWIIDITKKSSRQDAFLHLVGKMEHVHLPDTLKNGFQAKNEDETPAENDDKAKYESYSDDKTATSTASPSTLETLVGNEAQASESNRSRTLEEEIDEEERETAARQAVIQGDYWYYSTFDYDTYFGKLNLNDENEIDKVAVKLYEFQEDLIREGKEFIMTLRRSNAKPYQPINIVVLGDVREELTGDTDRNRIYDSATSILRTNVETMYVDSRIQEFMYLGLRMTKGVSRDEFKERFNRDMYEIYGDVINKYVDQGFMKVEGDRVRLTDHGIDVSNYILADFILD